MSSSTSIHDIVHGATPSLNDLIDRDALTEVLESVYTLFRIPIRVFDSNNAILAEARGTSARLICQYVDGFAVGRDLCESTVAAARTSLPPPDHDVVHPCFTGAAYKIFAVTFEGVVLGKTVLGPYLPGELTEIPRTLMVVDPKIEPSRVRVALNDMPRVRAESITEIVRHLRATLDVILFSGHRALLMSQMHVAALRESYRELQEKSEESQRNYERLKELDRLKSNFLATMSHELRTPLTSIIGYSEMLLEGLGGTLASEQSEFVATIREKGEQLLTMITTILDMAKLEQGTVNISTDSTSMATLASEVASTFVPAARKKRVHLKVDAQPGTPEALADRERMRQVLTNLIDNALKFTPAGGTVAVRVGSTDPIRDLGDEQDDVGLAILAPAHRDVEVTVTDSGIGIAPENREKIFDAFFQVDGGSTREYGGTGLGLSIVRKIVEGHGGTISCEDNPDGNGTRFVVRVPAAR